MFLLINKLLMQRESNILRKFVGLLFVFDWSIDKSDGEYDNIYI